MPTFLPPRTGGFEQARGGCHGQACNRGYGQDHSRWKERALEAPRGAKRCRDAELGTLQLEILVPHDQPDTLMLYEGYASKEAFDAHWSGASIATGRKDTAGTLLSLTGIRCDMVE